MIDAEQWRRTALWFGLATVGAYLAVALRLLPMPVLRMLFLGIGPLVAITVYALGMWLAAERDSVALRIAILLHVIAAAFVSAMALIQNVNRAMIGGRIDATHDDAARAVLVGVYRGIDAVQLGLDLAWDLWLTTGAIFLGVALVRHPRFGPLIGWTGIAVAALVLALNLWTFPIPPAQAGLVDAGPVMAVWYLGVILLAGRPRKHP